MPKALLALSFTLLASVALWAKAQEKHPLQPAQQVVSLNAAMHRHAPSKKADVHILARGDNAFMAMLKMAPKAKVPLHRDKTEEYIYILEGSGTIQIDGKKTKLKAGDAVYMPANAEVTFENGDKQLVGLQVFAGPQPADKYLKWPMAAK
ncbi:MAG: hypothetical protein CMH56_11050 [Myxococcales bacterium]|nr:hypothetical protein [Myxococcales bacterium]|tara:strand:+ start:719 stop:1168 length:450 start_codon:yes stop_codon:yes gene_type:complete